MFSKIKLLKNKLVSEQISEGRSEKESVWRISEAPAPTVTTSDEIIIQGSVSQPPGRGPLPGPGINYTGPREVLLEFVILVF